MKTAVELKKYSFRYANTEKWVLQDVDFALHYGELVVLSGMSGEGKSTLLSSINGIIPNIIPGEQKGEILIDGESNQNKKASEISCKVGSVLQNADSQIINSIVEDEIAFGCENLNMDPGKIEKQVDYACQWMGLDKNAFTKTLSGGQKQRLISASILAMQQKILIFDEPLANLDLEGAQILLKALKSFASQGYAVLLIEHRLDIVVPFCDKVAWLKEGKVYIHPNKKEALKNAATIGYKAPKTRQKQAEPCFSLKNMSYSIAGKEIVKSLNFTIYKGERVVILGENGCGKTTLMRLMARLILPSQGSIEQFIEEAKKRKPSKDWFKKVGFIYQNPNYQLFMPTVFDEVGYQSISQSMTDEVMEKFQLNELKDRHPQSLSEGQKRRLTIAGIIAMEPEVVLLDEPTVGQDYEGLKNLMDQLNGIHERTGNTLITITHDFRCAEALADKIIWMQKGEVYKTGTSDLAREYFEANRLHGEEMLKANTATA